jgi:hypothetical protein
MPSSTITAHKQSLISNLIHRKYLLPSYSRPTMTNYYKSRVSTQNYILNPITTENPWDLINQHPSKQARTPRSLSLLTPTPSLRAINKFISLLFQLFRPIRLLSQASTTAHSFPFDRLGILSEDLLGPVYVLVAKSIPVVLPPLTMARKLFRGPTQLPSPEHNAYSCCLVIQCSSS